MQTEPPQQAGTESAPGAGYKWLVLAVCGIGTLMSSMDGSIVTVIVPLIQQQYDATLGAVSWVSSVYLLVICSLLLTVGRLGDMWGFKGVFSAGFALFGLASLLCGLAPSLGALVAARALQGVGAAILNAIGPALISTSFPAEERGWALGLQATFTYAGLTVGPSLGGWIAGHFGWHWVFLINVPIGAAGALLAVTRLRRGGAGPSRQFDLPGAALFAVGLSSALLALSHAEVWGWHSSKTWGLLAGGVGLLGLFIWHERRTAHPALPLKLFRSRVFSGGVAAAFLQYASIFIFTFLLPFYLQELRGLRPEAAGAVMTAQPVVMVAVAAWAGWLADRLGARGPATVGLLSLGVGLWLFSGAGTTTSLTFVMVCLALVGLGNGLFAPPNNSVIMGAAPREQQGIASGLAAAARNTGMVAGIAIGDALFSFLRGLAQQNGADTTSAFLSAFRGTLWVAAAMAAAGAVLSMLRPVADPAPEPR